MRNILFVCLGNICRSPLAEAIFKHQVRQKGLENHWIADSCGTADYHIGDRPDPRTVRNALKNGISIQHIGRQFDRKDFDRFDLILAMDKSNLAHLLRLAGSDRHLAKLKLVRSYEAHSSNDEVPDPYYGSEKDFQEVFEILNRSISGLLAAMEKEKANS